MKITAERKESVNGKHCLQQAVWQDSGINPLKMSRVTESPYPAASASLPLPRQAAGTLSATAGRVGSVGESLVPKWLF